MGTVTWGHRILGAALMIAALILGTGCTGPNNGPVLFVINDFNARVVSFRNPASATGNRSPDTRLEGEETLIGDAAAMLTDSQGALYILLGGVAVFENAAGADGNRSPDRFADLEDLSFWPGGMALSPTEEWLLVVDRQDDRFMVYWDPTTDAFDGPVPLAGNPMAHAEFGFPDGAQYAGDALFVKDQDDGDIYLYSGGERFTISPGFQWRMGGFFIDQDDNLYVANNLQSVGIFRHASALEGDVEPDLILTVPDAETVGRLVVGSDGTGYIADRNRSAVYVYQDIANRDGEVAPDGTIEGPRTGLSGPTFLALYEPQE